MDAHSLPRVVSRQCSVHMHVACLDECMCDCHQVCARCLISCQGAYDVSEVIGEPVLVCANCYVDTARNGTQPRCEGCGSATSYRDPDMGRFYLCMTCHKRRIINQANPLAG